MKKKLLWCVGIVVVLVLVTLGVCRYIQVRNSQTDPNWELAQQIYNMENALKEVDEDYRYITEKRLILAAGEIEKGIPPSKAAALSGFNDYSGFYKLFKKMFGVSPSKYI